MLGRRRCCCAGSCEDNPLTVCVKDCATGNPIVGATVTVGGVGTCTTGGSGCCTIALSECRNYEITVSKSGYITYDNILNLCCGGTLNISLNTDPSVHFDVFGCCGKALPGATVTFNGVNYITNSFGAVEIGVSTPGTYAWSISLPPRFNPESGSVTISTLCATTSLGITLGPATGYTCMISLDDVGGDYPWPTSDTITFTDSVNGTCTATRAAYSAAGRLGCGWLGTITGAPYAGNCGCPDSTVDITYAISAGFCCEASGSLGVEVNFGGDDITLCPGGNQHNVEALFFTAAIAPGAPLSATGTFPTDCAPTLHFFYPTGTVTFTATGT